jgi:hypothetical protein
MIESDFRPSDGTFCRIISALRDKFYLEEVCNVERMQTCWWREEAPQQLCLVLEEEAPDPVATFLIYASPEVAQGESFLLQIESCIAVSRFYAIQSSTIFLLTWGDMQ